MEEMRELVTVEQAERAIVIIAVAAPIVGLVLGGVVGAIRRRLGAGLLIGLLCGAAGPAALAMWRVYNAITGRYGLDSVRGLLINLALFAAVGLAVGVAVGLVCRRRASPRGGQEAS